MKMTKILDFIVEIILIIGVGVMGSIMIYKKYGFEAGVFGTVVISCLFIIRQKQVEIKNMIEDLKNEL